MRDPARPDQCWEAAMGAVLAAADAAMFWQADSTPNDQLLLYCFAAQRYPTSAEADEILGGLVARARRIDDLGLRVQPVPGDLDYPRWVRRETPLPAVHHRREESWPQVLAAVGALPPLDLRLSAAALHLFGPVYGAPRSSGPVWVVVLQAGHALGDGRRMSAVARALLGGGRSPRGGARRTPVPRVAAPVAGLLTAGPRLAAGLGLGLAAWRLEDPDTAGAPALMRIPVLRPGPAGPERRLFTLVVDAAVLRPGGAPVTAGFLAVLREVLPRYLMSSSAGVVELTVARPPNTRQRNNFHTVRMALSAPGDRAARARAIAGRIRAARERDALPARRLARWADASAPAPAAALAVRLAARQPPPERIAGATVVSSVNRGPADLELAGGPVLFTAGFPALSPVHAFTLGLHGIGDTVTVSVTVDPSRIHDGDKLIALMSAALRT